MHINIPTLIIFSSLIIDNKAEKSSGQYIDDSYMYFGKSGRTFKRFRRDVIASSSTSFCSKNVIEKEATEKIKKHSYPLKDDKNYDLQLVWVGDDSETQLLLTTTQLHFFMFMMRHSGSRLYQSDDRGRTFENIQKKIGDTAIRSNMGIMKSPLNNKKLILISYTSESMFSSLFSRKQNNTFLLITENAGKNFTSVELPFILREGVPLLFHPKNENWIIALERKLTIVKMGNRKEYGQAFISKDFGKNWKPMMKGHVAETVKWGARKDKEGEEIYLSTQIKTNKGSLWSLFDFASSSQLTLWKSSDGGKLFEEIVEHCYNFGVQGDFVFASVEFKEEGSKSNQEKRIMHVSKDSGSTFNPIHVPEITADMFYAVVEMHKGTIFLHVDEPGDSGQGTLYISGADGIMYTKSLGKHFYTNSGYTDFFRIESMHGVYITQTLLTDQTLKSVITFDRGVSWQPLYVSTELYCKDLKVECTLHFHNEYSRAKGVQVQAPISSSNAPGIIMLHGQTGDALTGVTDVWLSVNGGYNWTLIAKGPHHYAIGDSGNLLVILPRFNTTGNILKYSIDQGKCWHDLKFSDDNDQLTIRGLVTEPHSQERMFSLWGYAKDAPIGSKEWTVVTVNFHEMFSRKCTAADYEEWYPHDLDKNGGCFLGEKVVYKRPMDKTTCYIGKAFNPVVKTSKCKCTKDDLECDYGYERESDGSCKRNTKIKAVEVCKNGEKEKERFSKGYRRVPGDVCKSDDATEDVVKYIDEGVKCVPSKENIAGIVKEEKEEKHREDQIEEKQEEAEELLRKEAKEHKKKKSKSHVLTVVAGLFVVIVVVVPAVWFGQKYIRKTRYKTTYTMSKLDGDGAESVDGFDPRPKSHRPYKDESEAEDDIMLPV